MEVTPIDVAVLGPLRVRLGEEPVALGDRARRLLLALLVRRGRTVAPHVLIDATWPDAPPSDPRNTLQAQISRLRRALGPAAHHLITDPTGYRLDLPPDAVDADRLRTAVRLARAHLDGGGVTDQCEVRAMLVAALDAWAGEPFLEATEDAEAAAQRADLSDLRVAAAERLAEVTFAGEYGGTDDAPADRWLLSRLRPLAEEHPLRESLHRALATTLARAGRHQEALEVLGRLLHRLRDDGLDPHPATTDLQRGILHHEPVGEPAARDRPADGGSRNLDVAALPSPTTTFIGRRRETAEVLDHLETARAVTLTGPGGTGKTRLAIEVAHRWAEQHEGRAAFVELGTLTDPDDVLAHVAAGMGVAALTRTAVAGPGLGAPQPLAERLASHLAERSMLIVLDNCEHVVDRAAEAVELLLSASPHVRVLATSREPLHVAGEVHVPVPPLRLDVEVDADPSTSEAVQLFLDRARAAAPRHPVNGSDLPDVAELCRGLDGLPLAIELAAARIATLPLPTLVERLADRFELLTGGRRTVARQRTLRAVVQWSYDLLDDRQQRLLRRLGMFSGPPSVELIETVCADEVLPHQAVLPTLTELADRSLLRLTTTPHGDTRVRLLETIRDFARLLLDDDPDVEVVRDRHARAFAARATVGGRGLQGHDQLRWLERIDTEHDELRAALDHLLAHDRPAALVMGCDLAWYWWLRRVGEGRSWIERALDGIDNDDVMVPVAQAWLAFLRAFDQCGDAAIAEAVTGAEAALAHVGGQLDPVRLATVRAVLAYVGMMTGREPARAARELEEALVLAQAAGDPWVEAAANFGVAVAAAGRGAPDVAMDHAQRVLHLSESSGDRWSRFQTLQVTAGIHARRGEYPAARSALRTASEIAAEMGVADQVWVLRCQHALVTMLAGDLDRAEQELATVLAETSRDGQRSPLALHGLGLVAHRAGDQEAAIAWHQEAAERLGAVADPYATAEAYAGQAFAYATLGRSDAAAQAVDAAVACVPVAPLSTTHPLLLEAAAAAGVDHHPTLALRRLGRAAALREQVGGVIVGGDRFDVDRIEERARRSVGDAVADAAIEEGRSTEGLLPPVA